MNIVLYHIEGISKEDTLYFESVGDQGNFFHNSEVKRVDDTWYPPFSTDRIKFSSDDLTVTTQVNYLALEDDDKTYYYFITGVEYDADGLIVVEIEMDYIQTFMFEAQIASGIVERKFIDRWDGNNINRSDYIRENVTTGEFIVDSTRYPLSEESYFIGANDQIMGWLVYAYSDQMSNFNRDLWANGYYFNLTYGFTDQYHPLKTHTNYFYYAVPVGIDGLGSIGSSPSADPDASALYAFRKKGESSDSFSSWLLPTVNNLTKYGGDKCVDCHFIPFNFIKSAVTMNVDSKRITYDPTKISLFPTRAYNEQTPNTALLPAFLLSGGGVPTFNYTGNGTNPSTETWQVNKLLSVERVVPYSGDLAGFSKNTQRARAFAPSMVPALLDENYVRIEWGENGNLSTFPFYQATTKSFYYTFDCDPCTGVRIYQIRTSNVGIDDPFNNRAVCTNPIYYDTLNSAWVNYTDMNRNWQAMFALDMVDKGTQPARNYIRNRQGSDMDPSSWKRMNKKRRGAVSGFLLDTLESGGKMLKESWALDNKMGQPLKSSTIGKYTADSLSNGCRPMLRISFVEDIRQCAQYYHRNGYLVNKYLSDSTSLSNLIDNDVMTRYYYGVLKMVECTVHLEDFIESDSITDGIAERLSTGIRLWRVDPDSLSVVAGRIANYEYDNVEISYL